MLKALLIFAGVVIIAFGILCALVVLMSKE